MQSCEVSSAEECLWCSHTCWMKQQVGTLVQWMECSYTDQPEWFQQMCKDLSCCSACVDQYHSAMTDHLSCLSSQNAIVYEWNCKRIGDCLEEALQLFNTEISLGTDEFCEDSIIVCIQTAIKEVLKHPRLMLIKQLSVLCLKSLKLLLERNKGFELHERLQGLCLLLVNQDPQVCRWALRTFKSFGSVDCDEYDELESVIDWLMSVINFNLFVNSIDSEDFAYWDETQDVVLPTHLFTNKPREFWLGICTVLSSLTKSCIQTHFFASESGHKELIESILALLDKNPDKEYYIPNFHNQPEPFRCKHTVFWPVLHCFVMLVDKMGSRFWIVTKNTPNYVFKLIKSNPYYQLQLNICYDQAARFDFACANEDSFSFSQIVYDNPFEKPSKSLEPLQELYHGFSLSWVVPLIKSLVDFGSYESSTVVEMLNFVCHIHSVSLHGDNDVSSTDLFQTVLPTESIIERVVNLFLPQESLRCISQSIDVLFSQKMYYILQQCSQALFCMITVLCSYVLSKRKGHPPPLSHIRKHLSQAARTYTSLVMYCSTKKTAGRLWYLVEQISSLSPFLSVVSNKADSNYTELSQPAELSQTLLAMIADKQNDQDIAGPFLYPASFDSTSLKRSTIDIAMIKQEPSNETTRFKSVCSREIKQESPSDDRHDAESSNTTHSKLQCLASSSKTTLENVSDDLIHKADILLSKKRLVLSLNKLPIPVLKSNSSIWTVQNNVDNCVEGHLESTVDKLDKSPVESDTDHISISSDDDDDNDSDNLPSYFAFSTTQPKSVSTSSTATLESNFSDHQSAKQPSEAKDFQEWSHGVIAMDNVTKDLTTSNSVARERSELYTEKSSESKGNLTEVCVVSNQYISELEGELEKQKPVRSELELPEKENVDIDIDDVLFSNDCDPSELKSDVFNKPELDNRQGTSNSDDNESNSCFVAVPVKHHDTMKVMEALNTNEETDQAKVMSNSANNCGTEPNHVSLVQFSDTFCKQPTVADKVVVCCTESELYTEKSSESKGSLTEGCVVSNQCISELEGEVEKQKPVRSEVELPESENVDVDIDDVLFSNDYDPSVLKNDVLNKPELDNRQGTNNSDDKESNSCFVVVPVKHHEPMKAMEALNTEESNEVTDQVKVMSNSANNCGAEPNHVSLAQFSDTFCKQRIVADKAVVCGTESELYTEKSSESKGSLTEGCVVSNQCISELEEEVEKQKPELVKDDVEGIDDVIFSNDYNPSELKNDLFNKPELDNRQGTSKSDDKESNSCFVVVPVKHREPKFKVKVMETLNTEELNEVTDQVKVMSSSANNRGAEPDHVSLAQFSDTFCKQRTVADKVQPAVVGRAPFSKSRMASVCVLNAITKVCKDKESLKNKDLHTKSSEPISQASTITSQIPKVVVKVELSKVHNKEEFIIDVLRWDPSFLLARDVVSEGPHSLPDIQKVPVTFKSSDQYVEVFKSLLLLETWDTIAEEMKHTRNSGKVLTARVYDCNLSSETNVVSAHHRLTCKGLICAEDNFPIDRDLVCIRCILSDERLHDYPTMFGIVESIVRNKHFDNENMSSQSSQVPSRSRFNIELILNLSVNRYNGSFHFLSDNLNVEILTVVSLSSFIRQWEGLISLSRNMLCRDILHPRHKRYFGCFDETEPLTNDKEYEIGEFSFNSSQFEAITLTTKALSLSYCLPQLVLLQGPPGTGKTHTIIGIIVSFFASQKANSLHSNTLPGNRLKPPKPHLLVCAPSNAGVDVVVNRLLMSGLITGTAHWEKRREGMKKQGATNAIDGFRVLRVGVPDKIDPQILPIFLDEMVKRKASEATKELQSIKDEIVKVRSQMGKLDEQITTTERMIVSLMKSGNKDDELCCKELKASVITILQTRKQLSNEHRKLTRKAAICSNDIKMIHQQILMEADIVCCTLTSSGSHRLRECFQSKPQYFTAVIVDEAAQCSELVTLIPLLYHSTKLVLVGDPAQLPSTVKSMKAAKLGYGQSLFERLFYYFNSANYLKFNSNPIKMLEMQYRMNSKICQFPSEQFYHGKLLTHSSCDKEILLKPLLVFDLYNGEEDSKDGCSYSNKLECQLIIKLCSFLLEITTANSIGIITPYKAQTRLIQSSVRSRYQNIEIGTVDSFQGREKDIILLSCVRVQPGGSIGFLTDCRRLNVAITRAKKALYIIGHLRTFQYNKNWSMLIAHAKRQNVIIKVDENLDCAKECLNGSNECLGSTKGSSLSLARVSENLKDKELCDKTHSLISSSSATELNSRFMKEKHPVLIDRSAFSVQRKSAQLIDPLPVPAKSPAYKKAAQVTSKRSHSSSSEPKSTGDSLELSPCKKKSLVTTTTQKIQRSISSSFYEQTSSTLPKASCATGKQRIVQPCDKTRNFKCIPGSTAAGAKQTSEQRSSLFGPPEIVGNAQNQMYSAVPSSVSHTSTISPLDDNPLSDTVCNPLGQATHSHSLVNVKSQSKVNCTTDKWGGQRRRTSHYADMSDTQKLMRKRRSDSNAKGTAAPPSKKTKLTT